MRTAHLPGDTPDDGQMTEPASTAATPASNDGQMTDVLARARRLLDGVIPGPWWWGGNTDHHGDVCLHSRMPGYGWVDIMRTCAEPRDDEAVGREWDAARDEFGIDAYIDRDEYIEQAANHPRQQLAFIETDGMFVQHARDHVVYEVARNQKLPDDTPRDHPKVYRADVVDIRNAHARFIAGSRQLVDDLVDEVEQLRAQVARMRACR